MFVIFIIVPCLHPASFFAASRFRGTKRRARLDVYDAAEPAHRGFVFLSL